MKPYMNWFGSLFRIRIIEMIKDVIGQIIG